MKIRSILMMLFLAGCEANDNLLFNVEAEATQYPCAIYGNIPDWLSGTLLRNGPAKFDVDGQRVQSWFDGLAMIHAFTFTPEKVLYTNRFLRSKQYHQMMVEKTMDFAGFAQDPCGQAFKHQSSTFVPDEMNNISNAVVNIAKYAEKTVALTEYPLPVVFDPHTFKTLGPFDYKDALPKTHIFESAHPQHDGETINYFTQFGEKSTYCIWKLKGEERDMIAEVPVDLPSYMHSFALTEKYVVLVEYPFVVNPLDLMQKNKPFITHFQWKPDMGATFVVVERASGKLISKIKTEPFFAFHHVNAFDEDDHIMIDMVTYPDASVIQSVMGTATPDDNQAHPQLQRFTIALNSKTISKETIFAESLEMPRVSPRVTARQYHFAYAVDYAFPTSKYDQKAIYKIDVHTKQNKSWSEEGCFPGEPIFVPNPQAQTEDDGVVLSLILDYVRHRSFLLILDAKDFTELARAETPHAIPVGLHGVWESPQ